MCGLGVSLVLSHIAPGGDFWWPVTPRTVLLHVNLATCRASFRTNGDLLSLKLCIRLRYLSYHMNNWGLGVQSLLTCTAPLCSPHTASRPTAVLAREQVIGKLVVVDACSSAATALCAIFILPSRGSTTLRQTTIDLIQVTCWVRPRASLQQCWQGQEVARHQQTLLQEPFMLVLRT